MRPIKRDIFKKFIAACTVISFICPTNIIAQSNNESTQKELERLEKEKIAREERVKLLEKNADSAAKEVIELQQRLVQAALDRDRAEKNVERSVSKLRQLREDERRANSQLLARREALENVVIALIAVEQDRPPALAVRPQNATEAARVAILMRLVAPQLNQRAQQISNEIGQLRQLRENILMSNEDYRKANTYLQNSKKNISVLIAQRRLLEVKLRKDADSEKKEIAEITQRASSLRELVTQIGQAFSNAADIGSAFASDFEKQQGKLLRPTNGITVKNYGATLEEGGHSTGMTIRTRQSAQVMSPYDGRIEFSAPFRSYGQVLIINVGGDYRVILAGLSQTYVEAGQEVLSGEPIGEMPDDKRIIPDLYVEFRKNNAPFDPAPWFKKDTNG